MVGCVLSQLKPSELYISDFGLGPFQSYECKAPRVLSYTEEGQESRLH